MVNNNSKAKPKSKTPPKRSTPYKYPFLKNIIRDSLKDKEKQIKELKKVKNFIKGNL